MSFRVWKGQSESPAPSVTAPSGRASLRPDVVEAAGGRLTVLALLTAGFIVLIGILDWMVSAWWSRRARPALPARSLCSRMRSAPKIGGVTPSFRLIA